MGWGAAPPPINLSAADKAAPKARQQTRDIRKDVPCLADHADRDTNAPRSQGGVHFALARGAFTVGGVHLDKLEFANVLNRISQIDIKWCNQQFLQLFIVVLEKDFYGLAIVFFCVKLPV